MRDWMDQNPTEICQQIDVKCGRGKGGSQKNFLTSFMDVPLNNQFFFQIYTLGPLHLQKSKTQKALQCLLFTFIDYKCQK